MATFERKLLTRATRIKKGWKGTPGLPKTNPLSSKAKAGDWLVEPDSGLICAFSKVWPDKLFRANFDPIGEEAERLLNPPREKILYESEEGHKVVLKISREGIWIRFKSSQREVCLNLCEVAAIRGLRTVEGPILREVLEDFVDHLGLEVSNPHPWNYLETPS